LNGSNNYIFFASSESEREPASPEAASKRFSTRVPEPQQAQRMLLYSSAFHSDL